MCTYSSLCITKGFSANRDMRTLWVVSSRYNDSEWLERLGRSEFAERTAPLVGADEAALVSSFRKSPYPR